MDRLGFLGSIYNVNITCKMDECYAKKFRQMCLINIASTMMVKYFNMPLMCIIYAIYIFSYLLKKVDRSLFYFKQIILIIRACCIISAIIRQPHVEVPPQVLMMLVIALSAGGASASRICIRKEASGFSS